MKTVARAEGVPPEAVREKLARGHVVIPANVHHQALVPVGIGRGLSTKVNANFGTSQKYTDPACELAKLHAAVQAGADAVMDLSTGGDIDAVRRRVVEQCTVPLGTVPVYQAAIEAGGPDAMTLDSFMDVLERHARDGVDFVTVHAGLTREAIPLVEQRLMGAVSRGGSFLIKWMRAHDRESFIYENFDRILDVCREHDVTMSLGDGLRPGCIADATDEAQLHELRVLGELTTRCREAGVQVMVEGPGHVPLQDVQRNMELQRDLCDGAPFYVLGPLPTDIAPGYDHVVSAIGGALAGMHGADFLCYVTPKEHVGLPNAEDVREGVIVSKIAAHIADVAQGLPGAQERDRTMARARTSRDWDAMREACIDPVRFNQMLATEDQDDKCSMCGEFCAVKLFREPLEQGSEQDPG
jgi:phosphomethylpyrimidine synthase